MNGNSNCGCGVNYSQGNVCNVCGYDPCRCKPSSGYKVISCQPSINPPKITIESLLKLIEAKCDKETCKKLQFEIDLLYALFLIPKPPIPPGEIPVHPPGTIPPVPTQPLPPGGVIPPKPGTLAFQLISNMVESLNGNIKNKYPSAELLKQQLTALWKCVYDKQQHHGEWKDNFTYRGVNSSNDKCLLDGSKDYAPSKIKVVTPVDVGSTVFNTIDGKNCLFESLVDNNITEPTKLSVLQGKWINYCDIKDVIDCVLPRRIITDCHENCDDPNHDGVHEDLTLCERVDKINDCVICDVVDTNSVDLTKTKLPNGIGNSVKADVILDPNTKNTISITPNGLLSLAADAPDTFVEDNMGIPFSGIEDPEALAVVKRANYHFTGTYPANHAVTPAWVISSGLAPIDPASGGLATEWFAIGVANYFMVDNALGIISGKIRGNESGFDERPVAYKTHWTKTIVEFVMLKKFEDDANQAEPIGNPVSPYATVNDYVTDKVKWIKANGRDTDTPIHALPTQDWLASGISGTPIKFVKMPDNPWMDFSTSQTAVIYARFINVSATLSTNVPGGPHVDDPNYVPGKMTPQPMATINGGSISEISGVYRFMKLAKPVKPKP